MEDERNRISEKARQELTIIAVNAIGLAQGINASAGLVDMSRVIKSLDEIEARAKSVRKKIGQ
jgi:hypothetical protein